MNRKELKRKVTAAIEAREYRLNGLKFSNGGYVKATNVRISTRKGEARCDLTISPELGMTEKFNDEEYKLKDLVGELGK